MFPCSCMLPLPFPCRVPANQSDAQWSCRSPLFFRRTSSRSCQGGSGSGSDFAIHRPNTDQLWAVCDRGARSMVHTCTIGQSAVKKEKWDSRDWKQQIETARPGRALCSQRHLLPHVPRADLGHPSLLRTSEPPGHIYIYIYGSKSKGTVLLRSKGSPLRAS